MTTLWTLEAMEDAKTKHQFIMVSPLATPRVSITDAQRLWMLNPNIVFQTGYRIAGTEPDITAALTPLGISAENIEDLMASSITSTNYDTTMSQVYFEELESYNAWRRSVLKANVDSPGVKLFDIMAAINPDVVAKAKATGQAKTLGVANKTTKGRGRNVKSLSQKLAELDQGKVLDVSGINPDGSGTKSIPPPVRVRKYGSPNLPMVSADLDHYITAINMLPGGQERYAADINYVRQLFQQTGFATTGAILTVPGDVPIPITPQVPLPTTTPRVPNIPQTTPQIPTTTIFSPVLHGTPIPQTEDVTPTKVYPAFTKRQREKKKETDNIAKGLPPRTGLPPRKGDVVGVTTQIATQQAPPIPFMIPQQNVPIFPQQNVPVFPQQNVPVFPQQNVPVFPQQNVPVFPQQNVPVFPQQNVPVFPQQNVPVFNNTQEGDDDDRNEFLDEFNDEFGDEFEDEFGDEEISDEEISDEEISDEGDVIPTQNPVPILTQPRVQTVTIPNQTPRVPLLPNQPIVPTVNMIPQAQPKTPNFPTIPQATAVVPQPRTPTMPMIPQPQLRSPTITMIPQPQTPTIPRPQTPTIPMIPRPQTPTIPMIPQPQTPTIPRPQTPTIPMMPQPRTPTIPMIPQPQTPTIPMMPQPRTPTMIPVIPQTIPTNPRTPTIPVVNIPRF